jgi:hypothetical protein
VHGASAGDIQDISKRTRKGQLHFLANVFANITIVRNLFLSSSPHLKTFLVTCWSILVPLSATREYS